MHHLSIQGLIHRPYFLIGLGLVLVGLLELLYAVTTYPSRLRSALRPLPWIATFPWGRQTYAPNSTSDNGLEKIFAVVRIVLGIGIIAFALLS